MQVVINGRKGHTIIVKYVVKRLCNAKGDNMKRNNKWLDLVLYILSAEVIGMSSGLLAGSFNEFFQKYNKPPLMPPSWVFPVVWVILYETENTVCTTSMCLRFRMVLLLCGV